MPLLHSVSISHFLLGLEQQHTHRAPHAQPGLNTDDVLAAIHAPDFVADGGRVMDGAATDAALRDSEEHGEKRLQTLMGMSLLLGFIFMLFVDQCGGGHSHAPTSGEHVHCTCTCMSVSVPIFHEFGAVDVELFPSTYRYIIPYFYLYVYLCCTPASYIVCT